MPTWNADQYLRFANERTQPCRDLASRIAVAEPRRIVDLGCGPGNSSAVLAERWPAARLTGMDSAASMIDAAQKSYPDGHWMVGDIATWTANAGDPFDIVFSNAALQWVPDHAALYPRLFGNVAPGGALAVQVPRNLDAPAHTLMRALAASSSWRDRFPSGGVREWHVHDPEFYYDLLAPRATRLDLWETAYLHVMPGVEGIVEWYRGTGMRPYLDALKPAEQEQFAADYLEAIRGAYPVRPDGNVLFPFQRLFLIAYRP